MAHLDSRGARGNDLMTNYGVTTILALVLLDGTGAITCQDGRAEVVQQQAAVGQTDGATDSGRPQARITSAMTATPGAQLHAGELIASGVRPRAGPAPVENTSSGRGPPQADRPQSPRLPVRDCDLPAAARPI
jgi:hypothetical protein